MVLKISAYKLLIVLKWLKEKCIIEKSSESMRLVAQRWRKEAKKGREAKAGRKEKSTLAQKIAQALPVLLTFNKVVTFLLKKEGCNGRFTLWNPSAGNLVSCVYKSYSQSNTMNITTLIPCSCISKRQLAKQLLVYTWPQYVPRLADKCLIKEQSSCWSGE